MHTNKDMRNELRFLYEILMNEKITQRKYPYITTSTVILTVPPLVMLASKPAVAPLITHNYGGILSFRRKSKTLL